MTKALRKAIMIRSRLKNRFNKTRSDENWSIYKTQRNFCTKLLRKTKKRLFFKGKSKGELLSRISQTKETSLTKS